MSLEDLIRNAATRGMLTHLSLAPNTKGEWQATFAPSKGANVIVAGDDPVKVLESALKGVPRARVAVEKPTDPHVASDDMG